MPNIKKDLNDIKNNDSNSFDSFVNAKKQIDTDHYYIHQKKKFSYAERITITTGNSYIYAFMTPSVSSGKQIHLRPPIISCSADKLSFDLYEKSIVADGSSVLSSVFNYNRTSPQTDTTMQQFKKGVTHSTPGTLLLPGYIGGGTTFFGGASGGTNREQEEKVLDINSWYAYVFDNDSSQSNVVNIIFNWYEENLID